MSISYPEPTEIVPAPERTAQDWVDYYLSIEDQVVAGKEVRFDNGRVVLLEDLQQIRRARFEWERRASQGKRKTNQFGGFRYKTPDMTR